MSQDEIEILVGRLEALLFTCTEPVPLEHLVTFLTPEEPSWTQRALGELQARLRAPHRGLDLFEVAGGWRLGTRVEHAELLKGFHKRVQKMRFTTASLETLSIIAYLQPVSTPEIETIRGVSVQQTVHNLIDKGLIKIVGRSTAPGRPLLYGTTEGFLEHFALPGLDALPYSSELEEWKKEFRSGSRAQASARAELASSLSAMAG